MNPKLALVIIVFSVVMVVFGNDPVEEARKKEEEKYKGINDPLIRAITEYHENEMGFTGSKGNGLDDQGRKQKDLPRYMYPAQSNGYKDNTRYKNNAKDYMSGNRNTANGRNNNTQQRNKGYYPPPPRPKNSNQPSNRYEPVRRPRSDSHLYLQNGQRLAYQGSNVFILDAQGNTRPLPDGKYRIRSGHEIQVVGGRKIIASN